MGTRRETNSPPSQVGLREAGSDAKPFQGEPTAEGKRIRPASGHPVGLPVFGGTVTRSITEGCWTGPPETAPKTAQPIGGATDGRKPAARRHEYAYVWGRKDDVIGGLRPVRERSPFHRAKAFCQVSLRLYGA